ncbi:MAG: DUF4347 domain-containing protein, partial [Betaproteobacteria bacterium]
MTDAAATPSAAPSAGQEIVFIDARLAGAAELLAGLPPEVEVVVLAPDRDGLAQIAAALDGRHGLTAIHVLAHGAPGGRSLGGGRVDGDSLQLHADDARRIGNALAPDGDLLLYGCAVAAGPAGGLLLQSLAAPTGADIAASTDATGAAALGGNWALEASIGEVTTVSLGLRSGLADYAGVLAGTFVNANTELTEFPVLPAPARSVIGDFDGDGDADILYQDGPNGAPFRYFRNDSAGGKLNLNEVSLAASPFSGLTLPLPDSIPTNVYVVADFNGDGRVDVWVPTANSPGRYFQASGASYVEVSSAGFPAMQGANRRVAADFDRDGDIDIRYQTGGDGSPFGYFRNNGSGSFTDVGVAASPLAGLTLPNIAATPNYRFADFNGDGRVDLWTYQNGSTGTAPQYLYLGQANGIYSSASTAGFPTFTSTRSLVADFDGDGDPDILLQKGVENTPLFYSRNDGNLTFTEFENLAGTPFEGVTASSTISARVADFDVDGDFDLWLPAPVGFASAYLRQDSARTNAPPTGSVTIAGTATQGLTLTASDTLADADGLGTIGYQWLRDGSTITGATNTTYVLTQADVGKAISVRASYTDGGGTAESATSAATPAVANVNDAPTGSVTIGGTATQGQTLTASNTLADADGLGSIAYQWLRGGSAIVGATGTTYLLTQADVGQAIRVRASYTDGFGAAESATSAATAAVANVNDAPTGSVTIAGTATQGQTLTASNTLADADGLGSIRYQWLRDGGTIAGATNTIYLLTQADVGKGISVRASYTDGFGTAESATSAATAAVANVNDVPEAAADSYTVAEDAVLAIAAAAGVLANDSDVESGDTLEASLGAGPTHGSQSLNLDGSLSYTPNADFSGSDGFTYRARDRAGALSNLVAVTLVVNPINDAPVAQNDSATVAEDLTPAATGNVATNDSDIDSSTLTVLDFASGGTTAAAGTTLAGVYGSLLLEADGSYGYALDNSAAAVQALNAGDTATDVFTYRVSDGSLSATATLAVTLQGRDDTITGDGGNDVLTGSAGRDTLTGGGGNDTISGGAGNDVLTGGSGSDVLDGGTGDDLLLAASEDGVWSAGDVAHNPYTRASARLEGRAQSLDRFDGGEGMDTLQGSDGNDVLLLDDGVSGDSAAQAAARGAGIEVFAGGA